MLIERLPKILGINYISVYMYVHVYQVELIPDFIYLRNTQKLATILDSSNCLTHLLDFLHIFLYFIWLFFVFFFLFVFHVFPMWRKTLTTIFTLEMRVLREGGTPVYPTNLHFKMMITTPTITGKLRKTLTCCKRKIQVGFLDHFWLKSLCLISLSVSFYPCNFRFLSAKYL